MHVIKLQRTDVFSVTQRIIMFAEGWFDLIPEKSGIDCIFFRQDGLPVFITGDMPDLFSCDISFSSSSQHRCWTDLSNSFFTIRFNKVD